MIEYKMGRGRTFKAKPQFQLDTLEAYTKKLKKYTKEIQEMIDPEDINTKFNQIMKENGLDK